MAHKNNNGNSESKNNCNIKQTTQTEQIKIYDRKRNHFDNVKSHCREHGICNDNKK